MKRADEQTLLVGPGRGIVTTLPDGTERIIFTAYDFTYSDDKSCAIYSDDGGKTWTRGADVAAWSSESVVTEADGKLYLFTRHGRAYYVSDNYGESWGPQRSTGLSYNDNCQLTAITYSEKIDGKTAILFAAPSSTSSRSNGKIFVGLVQEDGSLEWEYEFAVNSGNYAYSCMDELENGDIALLYESAGSAITYTTFTMKEILGLEKNIVLDQDDVYVEEREATEAAAITQKPNEKIATVTSEYVIEESTTLLYDHVSNANSSLASFSTTANVANSLEKAELVLTNVSGDVYKVYNPFSGKYAYKASSGTNGAQINLADSADSAANQLVFAPTTAEDGSVTFRICRASDNQRYTIFYNTNMDFNTNGGYNAAWQGPGASGSYELVLLEKQDTVSETDVIPGYARANEITSGETYIITYIWENTNNANDPVNGSVFVLDPTQNGTGGQTKLLGETVSVAKNVVTITGIAPGTTTAVVGEVVYNITVLDPTLSPSYAGADLPTEGMKLTAGTLEPTEGSLEALFDGDPDTFYHSNWSGARPADKDFWITIELPEVTGISGMRYLPRQSSANGRILKYEISYSLDGTEWTVAASGSWTDDMEWKLARFDENAEAKYVKIFAVDSKADNSGRHMTAAELRVLEAREVVEPDVPAKDDVSDVYPDVDHDAWYEPGVQYVYDKGIMSGSNGLFNPTGNITRAQVVATLYKLEGSPEVTDFKAVDELVDVAAGEWYTNAVCWAYNTGVTTGNQTTKMFNMSTPVTRQQLASFFYSYAELKELDTETRGDISGMAGADQVADYALDTMKWAVGTGLITGSKTTVNGVEIVDLKPTGTATRAQVAAMIQRFCESNDL